MFFIKREKMLPKLATCTVDIKKDYETIDRYLRYFHNGVDIYDEPPSEEEIPDFLKTMMLSDSFYPGYTEHLEEDIKKDEKEIAFDKLVHKSIVFPESTRAEILNAGKPFSEYLKYIMKNRGYIASEVWHNGNLDRRYFSKLMRNKIKPSKKKLFSIAIAMRLPLQEAEGLLRFVGYSFSNNEKIDLIVRYCIVEELYSIDQINKALYDFTGETLSDDE